MQIDELLDLLDSHRLSDSELIGYLADLATPTFDMGTAKAERQLKEWLFLKNIDTKITPSVLRSYTGVNLNYCKKVLEHENFKNKVEQFNAKILSNAN